MADSDLDPQAFLKTVRDLSDKRQREDDERYERLEAQILQDRTARLERKLERERSLSPVKTPQSAHSSNAGTPPRAERSVGVDRTSPVRTLGREDSISSLRSDRGSPSASERPASPTKPASPSAAMPSRANTMSWQRRPQSGTRSRPLSMLAAENASRASAEPGSEERPVSREEPSQQEIASALSSKDPTWFRQTPDRGAGSAAYRKQRDEEQSTSSASQRRHLPGLMEDPSASDRKTSPEPRALPPSPTKHQRYGSLDQAGMMGKSQLDAPATSARATTPEVERAAFGRSVPSLSSRPSVSSRPASPTKGMGGFVESAMMKRTDSVSKRWSNQPAGLGRQDSTASLKSPYGSIRNGIGNSHSMPRLDQNRTSAEPNSRPGSSHSTVSGMAEAAAPSSDQPGVLSRQNSSFHSRSKSVASLRDNSASASELPSTFSPPLSPSKRWSPSKSSWLESALSRPESPTKQMTPQSTQPSWMAELSKAKQQRNSVATMSSQDDVVVEMGTASVQSFQPLKASGADSGLAIRTTSSRDITPTERSKRDFTPPTKAKPASLSSKPSIEKLASPPPRSPAQPPSARRSEVPASPSTPPAAAKAGEKSLGSPLASPSARAIFDKPKPKTPSTHDLRSNLKPRQTSGEQDKSSEPEFRNALGKLKKASTQNYVAPDVLKNNILRGKAGLATTGGPQKTIRKDEFKESILQKKAEMVAKAPEPAPKIAQKPSLQESTPEALKIRKGLQRSDSSNLSAGSPNPRRDITPEALARHKTLRAKPDAQPPSKPSKLSDKPVNAPFPSPSVEQPVPIVAIAREAPAQEVTVPSKPSSISPPEPKIISKSAPPADITPASKAKSSAIADRFNPTLAGLLARGPPPQTSKAPADDDAPMTSLKSYMPATVQSSASSEPDAGQELTHMTKGRARGPKRRKPKAGQDVPLAESRTITTEPEQLEERKPSSPKAAPSSKPAVELKPKSAAVRTLSVNLSEKSLTGPKPPTPTESVSLPMRTAAVDPVSKPYGVLPKVSTIPSAAALSSPAVKSSFMSGTSGAKSTPSPNGTREPVMSNEENKENSNGLPSVKAAASRWGKIESPKSATPQAEPTKSPSREDEEAAMRSAGLLSSSPLRYKASKPDGLGIFANKIGSPKSPLSPPASGVLPPKPAKSSRTVSRTLEAAPAIKDEEDITTPRAATAPRGLTEQVLHQYFGDIPLITNRLELDAQSVLVDNAASPPGRTLRKSIQLLSDNGKLTPLPTEREYILFSSSMYIITHVFGNASGQRQTEVFLWAGKDVSPASIEDAQIFGKRVAKDAAAGARTAPPLVVVKQGKEPSSLFQALGGIVVIRKGSHADTATRPYMLCGRPHLGHIAFDEIDMSLDLLHSAFPYIVVHPTTIQDTKVYLWKGHDCSPETVGSARLISMDLASSDVVEAVRGKESQHFLSLFSGSRSTPPPAGMKLSDKATPRLFRIDVAAPRRASTSLFGGFWNKRPASPSRPGSSSARPTSSASNRSLSSPQIDGDATITIAEVTPFTQEDFEPEHIYLLDCISTILIIPGPLLPAAASQTNTNAEVEVRMWEHLFAQACLFGNDYAMLAAGMQDRSSVPGVKVLLGDLPGEVKLLFRGWDERRGLWGAAGLMAGARVGGEDILDVGEVLDCCAR